MSQHDGYCYLCRNVAQVEELKPYAISTAAGIVPDREYVVCTRLTDAAGWDVSLDTCNGGSRPGQQCCMTGACPAPQTV
jgi:hypothetical protein